MFNKIIAENLSVRSTEKLIQNFNKGADSKNKKNTLKDPDIQYIEQQFIDTFGTKVQLKGSIEKGKIEISYFSQEDLNRIIEILSDCRITSYNVCYTKLLRLKNHINLTNCPILLNST